MSQERAAGTASGSIGRGSYRIQVRGLGAAMAKLDPANPFYAPAVHRAFADIGKLGQAYVRARAPRRRGSLANAVTHVLDDRPVPRFVAIGYPRRGRPMPTRDGFRYPGALEGGPRFHYRSGPMKGRPTRGWLSGARTWLRGQFRKLLNGAAREIQAAWSAGSAGGASGAGATEGGA
jgi:hypothetical protein